MFKCENPVDPCFSSKGTWDLKKLRLSLQKCPPCWKKNNCMKPLYGSYNLRYNHGWMKKMKVALRGWAPATTNYLWLCSLVLKITSVIFHLRKMSKWHEYSWSVRWLINTICSLRVCVTHLVFSVDQRDAANHKYMRLIPHLHVQCSAISPQTAPLNISKRRRNFTPWAKWTHTVTQSANNSPWTQRFPTGLQTRTCKKKNRSHE